MNTGSLSPSCKTLIAAFGFLAASISSPALAHPHVFAEARLEVETTIDGTIAELRNVWRFDEVFSSSVVIDFDTNNNLVMDPDELKIVGSIVKESLEEFGYYTNLSGNGRDISVLPPEQMIADFQDGQLLLIFAVKPAEPMPLTGKLSVGVYDPTMYAAIDFPTDGDLLVTGPSADKCETNVVRPDPDKVLAENQASLTEAFFNDPGGNDISKLFATRIEINCK